MSTQVPDDIMNFAKKVKSKYEYDSGKIIIDKQIEKNEYYVAWVDLMGAGAIMSVSMQKTANMLARLHMIIDNSCKFALDFHIKIPINDGAFIIARSQRDIKIILRYIFVDCACIFIVKQNPRNRFMLRGSVSYGSVYFGSDMKLGLPKNKNMSNIYEFENVAFGSAIIQAYKAESVAPPFGVAVHESARAFAPSGSRPFNTLVWSWWMSDPEIEPPPRGAPLKGIKDALYCRLIEQLNYIHDSLIYYSIDDEKIKKYQNMASQYFCKYNE